MKSRWAGLGWPEVSVMHCSARKTKSNLSTSGPNQQRGGNARAIQELALHMLLTVFGSSVHGAGVVASTGTCEGQADGPYFGKLAVSGSDN